MNAPALKIEYSDKDECLVGRISGIRSIITVDSVKEIRKVFEDSVDFYLETCAKRKEEPEKLFPDVSLFVSVLNVTARYPPPPSANIKALPHKLSKSVKIMPPDLSFQKSQIFLCRFVADTGNEFVKRFVLALVGFVQRVQIVAPQDRGNDGHWITCLQ